MGDPDRIELVGGPLDGCRALRQSSLLPLDLTLVYASGSLDCRVRARGVAEITACRYSREPSSAAFFLRGSKSMEVPGATHRTLLYVREETAKILALATDGRLRSPKEESSAASEPTYGLAVEEKLREFAIEAFRRLDADAGVKARVSDEDIWALISGTIRRDAEWALLGSLVHIRRIQTFAGDCFGIHMPGCVDLTHLESDARAILGPGLS